MPVTSIHHDLDTLTLTIEAQFAAPVERIWAIYADPRQLEKIWGPPEYPATFVQHSLTPGSRSTYYMTSPEGERFGGFWDIQEVDEPHSFTYLDGFADADLNPNPDMPTATNVSTFTAHEGGTKAVYVGTYASREGLQQVLDMGVEEGSTSAINQIDALVA